MGKDKGMEFLINEVVMDGFKSFDHTKVRFNDNRNIIEGSNGVGKTSVLDAISWVLYDKNYNLTSLVHANPCSVKIKAVKDDEIITLERKMTDGKSEYFLNDVPVKAKEFEARFYDKISKEEFIAMTNPNFFINNTTDAKRKIIVSLGSLKDDWEIANYLGFTELAEMINKLGRDDVADMVAYKAKQFDAKHGKKGEKHKAVIEVLDDLEEYLRHKKGCKSAIKAIEEYTLDIVDAYKADMQERLDNEKVMAQLAEIDSDKANMLSESINSKFDIVDFKLQEFKKNGEIADVCVPVIDGFELGRSTNTSREMLAKLDICYGLQRYHKHKLPVMLDGAESLDTESIGRVKSIAQIFITQVTAVKNLLINKKGV